MNVFVDFGAIKPILLYRDDIAPEYFYAQI